MCHFNDKIYTGDENRTEKQNRRRTKNRGHRHRRCAGRRRKTLLHADEYGRGAAPERLASSHPLGLKSPRTKSDRTEEKAPRCANLGAKKRIYEVKRETVRKKEIFRWQPIA